MEGSAGANSSDFVRKLYKMLESPQDDTVVRWGNEGDSFVVLEVGAGRVASLRGRRLNQSTEREVHETHPPQTLQAQQLCQFCQAIEQVRLSQSAAQQRREWTVAVRRWGKTNPMVAPPGSICNHGKPRLTAHRLGNLNTRTSK